MKSKLYIHWLTEAHAKPLPREWGPSDDMIAVNVPMADAAGHSSLDAMRLASKMALSHTTHHFAPGMRGQWLPMAEIVGKSSEPQFLIREILHGKSMLHDRQLDRKYHNEQRCSTFHLFEEIDLRVWLDAGENVEATLLRMDVSTLYNLLGEAYAQALLRGLKLGNAQVMSLQAVPPNITGLLHSSISGHLAGGLRRFHAQAKVLDYLIALGGHFAAGKGHPRTVCKTQLLRDLRDELQHLEGNLPNLEALASCYGLPARTLNEQFKREYQQTLCAFIAEERLKAAHAALTHGRLAIKAIAGAVGFSNVNSFTKAFTNRFGYPPGSLRRGRGF